MKNIHFNITAVCFTILGVYLILHEHSAIGAVILILAAISSL